MHGNGGTGSNEHQQALAFNGGIQRRNSITEANQIHSLQPTGPAMPVSAAQLEGVRHGGAIDTSVLMGLIHPSHERPWDPNLGRGRTQIRTGRNFVVPDSGGGDDFHIRVHTRDDVQAGKNAASNASIGSVIRVEKGKQTMLSEMITSTNKMTNGRSWMGASSKDPAVQNSAHIPAILPAIVTPPPTTATTSSASSSSTMPTIATPPRSRAWQAMSQIGSLAGTALWHGSGASQIVGGSQQFARNMQAGGTWTGAGIGAARVVAGTALMGTLATSAPVRAVAGAGLAGLSAMAGMFSSRR